LCAKFWWGNLRERDHLEDPDVDARLILRLTLKEVSCEGMDWIDVAQDRYRWRALVNEVMNMPVPQNAENFLTS